MTIIYALSGIALNHIKDWNPSYSITRTEIQWRQELTNIPVSEEAVLTFLREYGEQDNYKSHYYPVPGVMKIFIQSGSVEIDMTSGYGVMEKLKRRPILYEVNYLHYNPEQTWMWFSDIYCVALIIITITGLFVLKGKKGIKWRGAWFAGVGIVIPLVFLIMYL